LFDSSDFSKGGQRTNFFKIGKKASKIAFHPKKNILLSIFLVEKLFRNFTLKFQADPKKEENTELLRKLTNDQLFSRKNSLNFERDFFRRMFKMVTLNLLLERQFHARKEKEKRTRLFLSKNDEKSREMR